MRNLTKPQVALRPTQSQQLGFFHTLISTPMEGVKLVLVAVTVTGWVALFDLLIGRAS